MRPALVLIHGFASSTLVWSKVFLAGECRLSRYRAGHVGLRLLCQATERRVHDRRPGETVNAFARRSRIPRAIFVGSSYGGAVAATCALDYPDRVEKLILVGTVNNNRPLAFQADAPVWFALFGDVVSPLLIGSRRLLRRRMKRVYDRHAWVLDERRVDARHFRCVRRARSARSYARCAVGMLNGFRETRI